MPRLNARWPQCYSAFALASEAVTTEQKIANKRRWIPLTVIGIVLAGSVMAMMPFLPLSDPVAREAVAVLLAFGIGVVLALIARLTGRRTTGH